MGAASLDTVDSSSLIAGTQNRRSRCPPRAMSLHSDAVTRLVSSSVSKNGEATHASFGDPPRPRHAWIASSRLLRAGCPPMRGKREHEMLPDRSPSSDRLPSLHLSFDLVQESLRPPNFGRALRGPRHEQEQASQESNRLGQNIGICLFRRQINRRSNLMIGPVARLGEIGRSHDDPNVVTPGEQAEFGMLLAGPDAHGQHIPTERVLNSCLRVVHQHACIDATKPALALEQECQILAIRLGIDLQESGQTLLVEQPRCKGVGGRKAPDGITCTPAAVAKGRALLRCWMSFYVCS